MVITIFVFEEFFVLKEEIRLLAIRSINNNTVICKDSKGVELIAMGKGIGFGTMPKEIPLEKIERTFYDVDAQYQKFLPDLPSKVLEFSARIIEIAYHELPYELSPNLVIALADHINFALERAKKNIRVKMPTLYDVKLSFPNEYRIGEYAVKKIRKEFKTYLPEEEIVGIAMGILNGRKTPEKEESEKVIENEEMLEDITEIIERKSKRMIDRESFSYSRFATHMLYLFQRIQSGNTIQSENLQIYHNLRQEFPEIADDADEIAENISQKWKCTVSEEEKLYIMLHVNRICTKEGV